MLRKNMQSTSRVLLVKPAHFGFNIETEKSNAFQHQLDEKVEIIQEKAVLEFEAFAATLSAKGVEVFIFDDTPDPVKPDAVFPNNWISFHHDGTVILYSMQAPNRRFERRMDILESIEQTFNINRIIDLTDDENQSRFLEGTGSVVFDHVHRIAYACLSPRTDKSLLLNLCKQLKYEAVYFYAHDEQEREIYHTNVMMCIGPRFAVVCLESIHEERQRAWVSESLIQTGHQIIEIAMEQMRNFAGNMLCLKNQQGQNILVLSATAYGTLYDWQIEELNKYAELLPLNIPTIETIGGGSAKCMIAELFLEKK